MRTGSAHFTDAVSAGGISITPIVTGPLYALYSTVNFGVATANFAFAGTVPAGLTAGLPGPTPVQQHILATFRRGRRAGSGAA